LCDCDFDLRGDLDGAFWQQQLLQLTPGSKQVAALARRYLARR
jgi:hypothetical protein